MSGSVAIAGVAMSDVGRVDDKGPYELIAQASRRALADAGLTPDDVDGLASTGQGTLPPVDVGEYLGLRPRWIDSTAVGGASWEVMAAHAAGLTEVILPIRNAPDLEEVPADVREHMTFHPVSTVHEVLALALEPESLAKVA